MVDTSNISRSSFRVAAPVLKQRLNGFLSKYSDIKIGATTDALKRWRLGYADQGWSKMVVLYSARSAEGVRQMERELIAHGHACNFRISPLNVLPGGESIRDGEEAYYVYIVVGEPR